MPDNKDIKDTFRDGRDSTQREASLKQVLLDKLYIHCDVRTSIAIKVVTVKRITIIIILYNFVAAITG